MPRRAGVDAPDLEGRQAIAFLRPAGLAALAPHLQQIGPVALVEEVHAGAVFAEGEAVPLPLAPGQEPPAGANAVQGLVVALAPRRTCRSRRAIPHSPAHSDQVRHRPLSAPFGGA